MACLGKILKMGIAIAMLGMATPRTQANSLLPENLLTLPNLSNSQNQKIAGVYWLPDYLKNNDSLGFRKRINDKGYESKPVETCEQYGLLKQCPNKYVGTRVPNITSTLSCYKDCHCEEKFKYDTSNCSQKFKPGENTCNGKSDACDKIKCENRCEGFKSGISCVKGQTLKTCDSDCEEWITCEGKPCPMGFENCTFGCKNYSKQEGCEDICLECKPEPLLCQLPNIIKETYWCDGSFSCWQVSSDDVCQWCNHAWRCLMP